MKSAISQIAVAEGIKHFSVKKCFPLPPRLFRHCEFYSAKLVTGRIYIGSNVLISKGTRTRNAQGNEKG